MLQWSSTDRLIEGVDHASIGAVNAAALRLTERFSLKERFDGCAEFTIALILGHTLFGNPGQFNYVAAKECL